MAGKGERTYFRESNHVSRWGSGGRKSLERENHAWLSWHFGLSHSVIQPWSQCLSLNKSLMNDLKGKKECRNNWLLSGKRSNKSKDNKSFIKTPSSVSVVKISLKCSTTRQTGTWGMMMLTFSNPCDFIQLKLGLCSFPKPLHEYACVLSLKLPQFCC